MSFICKRIKNHYYLSIALHLASLWNRGLSQLGNSPYWWGLICLLHYSAHSNLQLALYFLLIATQIKRLTKIIFDSKQSRVFRNWSIWVAIGNKTFETVYSNSVTSENKTIHPPPPPTSFVHSKLGYFVVFYRQLEQQHNIAWRGWGRKSFISSFWSLLNIRKAP